MRLTFTGSGATLALSGAKLKSDTADWPLALSGGEATDAPRQRWTQISLSGDGTTLTIDGVRLHFMLFGVPWDVSLPAISFEMRISTAISVWRRSREASISENFNLGCPRTS